MAVPNFLVIGDLKAGSTSIYHYLRQHPDVYMPDAIKELRYFAYDPDNPYHIESDAFPVRTYEDYLRYFSRVSDERAIGEASPNYIRSMIAAERISRTLPNIRLIASLRNPADRLFSAYQMSFRKGRTNRTFVDEVFRSEAALIKANFYWPDLKRYFDRFPRDRIKIVLFDDLTANAARVAEELYRFLGVNDTFSPDLAIKNVGGLPRSKRVYALLKASQKHLKRLGTPPARLLSLWRQIERGSLRKVSIDPHLRKKILQLCYQDILSTQELIGHDLSAWLR